jgi:cardiolipin synthase
MGSVATIPNLVSAVRILLIPAFIWLVVADETAWAGLLLGVIGSTDWVDGYLARKLDQVTEVGKMLDPVADRLAVAIAVVLGLIAGVLPPWLAWAIIVRELLIGIGAVYGWANGVRRIDVRWLGKAATLLLYVGVTWLYIADGLGSDVLWWIAMGFAVPGVVLYYIVGLDYFRDMRSAIAADRGASGEGDDR